MQAAHTDAGQDPGDRSRPTRAYSGSSRSDGSSSSASTAPTECDVQLLMTHTTKHTVYQDELLAYSGPSHDPDRGESRQSIETYASSIGSRDHVPTSIELAVPPRLPSHTGGLRPSPTSPSEFGRLFPSARRLRIAHDESTPDGNMNLVLTTNVRRPGSSIRPMVLYHLRVYDVDQTAFSLRRYHRDSGREVCQARPYQPPPPSPRRPGPCSYLRRILAWLSAAKPPRRSDCVIQPRRVLAETAERRPFLARGLKPPSSDHHGDACTVLSFANYCHVLVGVNFSSQHNGLYTFEYWGVRYRWMKTVFHPRDPRHGPTAVLELHPVMTRERRGTGRGRPVAIIALELCDDAEVQRERCRGGWVLPAALELGERVTNDLADVIVATGMFAVVHDAWRSRKVIKKHSSQIVDDTGALRC